MKKLYMKQQVFSWTDKFTVKDENDQPKPMIPPTKEGLLRVIDNRKRGGKFLYVTRKGVHAIE
jgi:uncharacterized protein YxjI